MIQKRYKKVSRKTGLAFISVALLWLLYAFVLPMYRVIDFTLLIIFSIIAFFIVDKYAPRNIINVEITDEPIITGNSSANEMILVGNQFVTEIKATNDMIKNTTINNKVDKIIDLLTKILSQIKNDPKDATMIKQFMNFYLPTITKLLNYYLTFEKQAISGDNISTSMQKIDELLDNAIIAFKKALDGMFADEALDITTDIAGMENMLASRGLSEEIFNFK
ncbi:MAG: 5-bromo-4-chloroindolyl phosphate hydrolysis family protein [Erysipelotrichaceae bacterium]|nr:5-bromo-4-chloroindolyl phosphate hydrolysis family protein [Erysipelotrichaceae bacterium]